MRLLAAVFCCLSASYSLSAVAQEFLNIPKEDLCRAEPDLATCRHGATQNTRHLSAAEGETAVGDGAGRTPAHRKRKHYKSLKDYYRRKNAEYYAEMNRRQNGALYSVYPSLRQKDGRYCGDMQAQFAFTCQPSKPLRIDLVEFCKDYSAVCGVPNFHRLPGPRMGPPVDGNSGTGHVGVNGHFGLGVGSVPGLEVTAGWGVDVGPLPGMGESVGVGLGLDLGLVGSKSPEAYRRGMDNPNEKGSGVVGISGGVGVKAPGSGGVGVGSGIGVGK